MGGRYRLCGYFCRKASPSSIFFLASVFGVSEKFLNAASSSGLAAGGGAALSSCRSCTLFLSCCCAGGCCCCGGCCCWLCATAIPAKASSSPVRNPALPAFVFRSIASLLFDDLRERKVLEYHFPYSEFPLCRIALGLCRTPLVGKVSQPFLRRLPSLIRSVRDP